MAKFMAFVARKYNTTFTNYHELQAWSTTSRRDFWGSFADFTKLSFLDPYEEVVVEKNEMYKTKWFTGATLNFAQNLLRFAKGKDKNKPALVYKNNTGFRKQITYEELYSLVAKLAAGLRKIGVTKGDVVASYMPNQIETVASMLATASIGAIWASSSPDFGASAVADRTTQLSPKVLIACSSYTYAGKSYDTLAKAREIVALMGCQTKLVIVSQPENIGSGVQKKENELTFSDLLAEDTKEIWFEKTKFDHPLYVMFSSGTTGPPKCIVHSVGGTLIQHAKELSLHTDITEKDVLFYYTNCGWMMWNWMVSGLFLGATIVLYDGAPNYPNRLAMWEVVSSEKVSVFGTSARYLIDQHKAKIKPKDEFDLSSLKTVLSTGSPLNEAGFHFVYENVKNSVMLSSISGGTDIISCFALGCPILPVVCGELQAAGLGMDLAFYNESNQKVFDTPGELVCQKPFPSMPVCYWGDKDNQKYKKAYFEKVPPFWAHGDYGLISKKSLGVVIYGRSDTTLNPGGVRIGTAEIYRPLEQIDEVLRSVVVGQKKDDDVKIVLYVVLRKGVKLGVPLRSKISDAIKKHASKRHIPHAIVAVGDIPTTINGKISETAASNAVNGLEVKNLSSLANPDSLRYFREVG